MNKIKQIRKRLVKNAQAVSPIIATLMLVLVAVGSAGAFYVWQSGWQSDVQEKTGGAGELQASMTIGGSTTVYEFGASAAQYFEAANPNYKINVQKGGSGAGIAAVGTGAIDIGMSSKPLSATDKTTYPDLNGDGKKDIAAGELTETWVATDAVVLIVKSGHSLKSMNDTVLKLIYDVNSGKTSAPATGLTASGAGGKYIWQDIPQENGTGWGGTKCSENTVIKIYDRSDVSGTEDTFSKHFVDTGFETLEEAGIICNHVESNQVMVTTIAASADNLGFAAYGVAKAATGLKMIPVTLNGNKGTLAGKWADPNSQNFITQCKAGDFEGAKKLYFITIGTPSGDKKTFVDFCLAPEINAQICTAGGYINRY